MATPLVDRASVVLSVNRGLWGEVSSNLRSVQVSYNESEIHLFFVFDKKISEQDKESVSLVATSVAADFPSHSVHENCIQSAAPERISFLDGRHVVFLRKENFSDE